MTNTYKPNDVDRKPWIVFTGDDEHLLTGEAIADETITGNKIADNTIGPEKLNHVTNVFQDGYYPEMSVGNADSLSNLPQEVTFAVRETVSGDGVAHIQGIKGNTVRWNQLVQTTDTSVTPTSGHKVLKRISGSASIVTSDGTAISVTGATDNVFDLTLMFGAGNEPATVAEFEALFPESYYPYDAGSLKSVNITGVATEDASGKSVGTLSIPLATYFPTGMKSAGMVHDELAEGQAVTRIGAVDLGTLDWVVATTAQSGKSRFVSIQISSLTAPPPDINTKPNAVCSKYTIVYPTNSYNNIEGITINNGNGNVIVYDETLATSTAAQVKTALSGVWFFYELKTPTTQTIDPPLNLRYRVAEGGTEEITTQSGVVSAPVISNTAYPMDIRKDLISKASFDNFCTELGTFLDATITATYDSTDEEYDYVIEANV